MESKSNIRESYIKIAKKDLRMVLIDYPNNKYFKCELREINKKV
jgi:hypothetical protein